jgi:transposase/IS5 family transposase
MRFLPYQPDQGYLLPPSVADVLGPDHLCFFLRRIVERLDLSAFEKDYSEEGQPGYHPALMVSVWLYAYALGITSSRRLEQRIREDLPLRYLAGGAQPDFWTLNAFRRRHPQALNDLFTHVVELAQAAGLGRLGHVAIDSSRVAASASPDRVDSRKKLRAERARIRRQIRRWQRAANAEDPNEQGGMALEAEQQRVLEKLEQRLQGLPGRLQELKKSQLEKRSRTDPDSRFLHQRGKFVLGYTATLASSEDHLILEQRVGQNSTDYESLVPMVEGVRERCGERPQKVSADSGFFTLPNVHALEAQGIDLYLPDPVLAKELNTGRRVQGAAPVRDPAQRSMRRKLRHRVGRAIYQQRKATIEPIFGVLKEQRGLRRFRLRGLAKVGIELALACTAYNITRMWRTAREETAQA